MSLLVQGLSHKTAPIQIRELLSFDSNELKKALPQLNAIDGIDESMIVSTCNRTELYCKLDTGLEEKPIRWLAYYLNLDIDTLKPHFYSLSNEYAVRHALRVGSGLDSLVVGEPQILGQLKKAYKVALEVGTAGKFINKLMQDAFTTSKIIRTKTEIGQSPVSVAFAATKLAQQIHGDLANSTALIVGAGQTTTLVARHLSQTNIGKIYVANRTRTKSELVTKVCGGDTIELTDIPKFLQLADIVISSVTTRKPIISLDIAKLSIKKRKGRPIFFVDLGVPRNIEESVGSLESSFLYTIDDLKIIVESNIGARSAASIEAEEIVNFKTSDFLEWEKIQSINQFINCYRAQAEDLSNKEIEIALKELRKGSDVEKVIRTMGKRLSRKLIHTPTSKLKEYADEAEVLSKAIDILGIDVESR
ncbi:MAG: glutamyl-tRNA reductase [Methylococcaceae bacterium TMED69]|nr:MAG: glutamyl-tRNA reductase [Methylococcaceae bacterium TMED69]|tara:strand:+ start:745 stop:2001 length:1257 start_codon:yes stop_codon:yes gene_type:complete